MVTRMSPWSLADAPRSDDSPVGGIDREGGGFSATEGTC